MELFSEAQDVTVSLLAIFALFFAMLQYVGNLLLPAFLLGCLGFMFFAIFARRRFHSTQSYVGFVEVVGVPRSFLECDENLFNRFLGAIRSLGRSCGLFGLRIVFLGDRARVFIGVGAEDHGGLSSALDRLKEVLSSYFPEFEFAGGEPPDVYCTGVIQVVGAPRIETNGLRWLVELFLSHRRRGAYTVLFAPKNRLGLRHGFCDTFIAT